MNKEIILYTRPKCPFSLKLKELLNHEKIFYTNYIIYDIDTSNIYKHKDGHIPTPQVKLGDKTIWDYTTEENLFEQIKEYLKS